MADLLKNNFNKALIVRFGIEIKSVHSPFDLIAFKESILNKSWETRELKDRMRHVSICIFETLQLEYPESLKILLEVAPKFRGFEAMVFPDFVEVFGLGHEDLSLNALEEMTKYSSSEFAIRPFVIQNPKKVMGLMNQWSRHENHHVRRLASEGCRPRLPWSMTLPDFKKDPSEILPILENLKNDDSLYVRKSVANNLNDITKDNPDVVLDLVKKWHGKSKHTDWIIKNGLRTLLKKGNEQALDIFGFNDCASAEVGDFKLSTETIKIGGVLFFEFYISHKEINVLLLKIGFTVSYMKSNGKTSDKIFHITEKEFEPSKAYVFKKKLSFKDLSTRKHYSGEHVISLLINGKKIIGKNFNLVH